MYMILFVMYALVGMAARSVLVVSVVIVANGVQVGSVAMVVLCVCYVRFWLACML